MKENIIKTRNNMIGKLFDWLHSNMEFRIREERIDDDVWYYPQVKGGILGKLGIWRYFAPLSYDEDRHTIWVKTELIRNSPMLESSRDYAEKCVEKFIKTLVPFKFPKRDKKRVSYKYRTVGSDGTIRYI